MKTATDKRSKIIKRAAAIIAAVTAANIIISYIVTVAVCAVIFGRYETVYDISDDAARSRELVSFKSGDNLLQGYYYGLPDSEVLAVIVPGFHAGADGYTGLAMRLLDTGYSVFSFDPTGCNLSEGDSSVGFSMELLDLREALDFIDENDKFGNDDVVLIGHSMGGYAAACVSGFGYETSAIVTVSGVNSAMEGIIGGAYRSIGALAYTNYPNLFLCQTFSFGADVVSLRADRTIESSGIPTLVIHGRSDEQYPSDRFSIYSHMSEMNCDTVTFALVDGGHTDLLIDADGHAVSGTYDMIAQFIAGNLK